MGSLPFVNLKYNNHFFEIIDSVKNSVIPDSNPKLALPTAEFDSFNGIGIDKLGAWSLFFSNPFRELFSET